MGKHTAKAQDEAPKGYRGKHTARAQAEARKPDGFRPGDPERFKRLDEGRGDWFTGR